MVEPHAIVPEKELNRLEEMERNFNQLKVDYSNLEGKLNDHECDHSACERKYNRLNDRFEKILFHKNKVDQKEEELKKSKENQEESHSGDESPEKSEEEGSSEVMREPYKNKNKESKKNPPWYYIGDLSD